jgi:hypothetical protein
MNAGELGSKTEGVHTRRPAKKFVTKFVPGLLLKPALGILNETCTVDIIPEKLPLLFIAAITLFGEEPGLSVNCIC